MAAREPGILDRLAAAVEGLVYSSESDRPLEVFHLPPQEVPSPLTPATLAERIGADPSQAEERPPERFLERHIEMADWRDPATPERVARYDRLRELLLNLRQPRFFRFGRVEVRCLLVGLDAAGALVGVQTVAVET